MKNLRILLVAALALLPFNEASAATVQITVKDAGGTTRNINVTTNTDITGNLVWNNVICDQAAGTTCASVGTAGSPSTNALTVQAVTLGHGTAANAMRVELPTDGTGVVGVTTWAGGTLGAMANYGTSPGAVLVPGVNAFVTNATPGIANNADGITAVAASSTSPVPVNSYNYALNSSGTWDRVKSTKGNLNVVNGGSTYQHVAASQTAAVLQTSTGAAGDYLSHCVIYPSTTAAGSVTVFDNANAAATNVIEFTTGTLSNLAPIAIPIGAVSTAGAWKVTTGANETVVCYGKFS